MAEYEYKVIPAPRRGIKAKGVKTTEGQFANALTLVINEAAAEGWEYQRTDTLPCDERAGLRGVSTSFQNMLVFRRMTASAAAAEAQEARDKAEAQRATFAELLAHLQAAALPAATPAPDAPQTEALRDAGTGVPAQNRVQETLAARTPGATPKVLTPDLRASPDARMAAE